MSSIDPDVQRQLTFQLTKQKPEYLELFEKIFLDFSKYYYKDMKKSVKIRDRIVSVDEVK